MSEVYTEESVISALLRTEGEILAQLPQQLSGAMFQDEIFANAYGLYQAAYDKGEKLSLAVLQQQLGTGGIPAKAIETKLHEVIVTGYAIATAKQDALALIRDYKTRQFNELLSRVQAQPDTLDQAIDYLTDEFENLRNDRQSKTKPLPQIVRENKDKYFRERTTPLIELEFSTTNDMVGGLEPGDVIVIGARPAVGKSAFATQLASYIANLGKKIAYFNLEMMEKQIYERFVSAASGIGLQRIRRAIKYTGDEEQRFAQANMLLEEKDKIIITTGSQTVSSIRSFVRNGGYDLIIVDYLQLIKPEGRYRGNRIAEVGDISHGLKSIAIDYGIPVILLSQLNRVSMGRENKEPTMSELRESGDIEQDASVILLLWNLDEEGRLKGLKVEKNRQGKTGRVTMQFNGDLMKFEELTDSEGFEPIETAPDIPFAPMEG